MPWRLSCCCHDSRHSERFAIAPVANTLVVEDDANILNLLSAYLESAGYNVVTASNGDEGLRVALSGTFDICVFDEMLPSKTGSEIATAMRRAGLTTPILFLSALGSERDVLRGFSVGADDYIIKPFSPRELLVRVHAILKRSASTPNATEHPHLETGPIWLEANQPNCQVNGKNVSLTPHEHSILRQLLAQPNRTFERGTLIAAIYGNEFAVSPKAIDVHVHHLRAKLGTGAGAMIETVRGFGYRFVPEANPSGDSVGD